MDIKDLLKRRDELNDEINRYFEISTYLQLEPKFEYFWRIDDNSLSFSEDRDNIDYYNEEIRNLGAVVRKQDGVAIPLRLCTGENAWFVMDPEKEVK